MAYETFGFSEEQILMRDSILGLLGRALTAEEFRESCLYAGDYDRRFRPVGTEPRFPEGTE